MDNRLPYWPLWVPIATVFAVLATIFAFGIGFVATGIMKPEMAQVIGPLLQIASIFFFLQLFAKITGGSEGPRFGILPISIKSTVGWSILGIISWHLTAHFLSQLFYGPQGNMDQIQNTSAVLGLNRGGLITFSGFICVGLIGPITEELLFRGVLFPALARWIKVVPAMFLSSILFALVHFTTSSPFDMTILTFFGIICACLYRYSGSLIPSMIFHAFNNTAIFCYTMHFKWYSSMLLLLSVSLIVYCTLFISTPTESTHEELCSQD